MAQAALRLVEGSSMDKSKALDAALSQIETGEARKIAAKCLESATADEVEEIVRDEFRTRWPDLFPPRTLPKESEPSA